MSTKNKYPDIVESQMVRFYCSLNERDRRRYAAIEAAKLGHGGIQYMIELNAEQEPSTSRVRQPGGEDES